MTRGRLRIYLGVAPGVGTTYAMLDEGRRRRLRGADVVVGVADLHERPALKELISGLERLDPTGALDVEAVLARRPEVVLVDDLAGTGQEPAGARWAAVERLRDAGIDVVGTLDIRAVASLSEVVEQITGERPEHTVPDSALQFADQVELVDMTPQALRRRLAHGGLYPAGEIDAARAARFHPATVAALRELALAWLAGVVRGQHTALLASLGAGPVDAVAAETQERILVALPHGDGARSVLHRAMRLAARSPGAELHAVHVVSTRRLPRASGQSPDTLRALAHEAGVSLQEVIGDDVARALLDVATAGHATSVVVGTDRPPSPSGRARPPRVWRRPVIAEQLIGAGTVDVHVVPVESLAGPNPPAPAPRVLSQSRLFIGFALAVALPVVITAVLLALGPSVGLAGDSLLLLIAVVVTALVGGLWPALVSAVVGSTVLNFFFIPPIHTLRVAEPHNIVTLVGFVVVGILVSAVVHRAASMSGEAARASTESRALAAIAEGTLQGREALPALVEQLRSSFGMTSVSLLSRSHDTGPTGGPTMWHLEHSTGPAPALRPEDADVQVAAGRDLVLALSGRTLAATDRTILRAFAAQAQGLLERDQLARSAAVATRLEATERLRDALLAAVGHDLRTPIASARAAVSSLRSSDIAWSAHERDELLAAAEESLARLSTLVADLLDLSRLRAGVLTVGHEAVWLDDLVPPALDELGVGVDDVVLTLPDDLPPALADPALVTRVIVNVLGNALRYSPPGSPPLVAASATADRVELRVVDRGPGIPAQDLARVFSAFQRLGDTENRQGLGLGLALSRGLVEAMGGTVEPEETPSGGLTMVVSLPTAPVSTDVAALGQREREEPAP